MESRGGEGGAPRVWTPTTPPPQLTVGQRPPKGGGGGFWEGRSGGASGFIFGFDSLAGTQPVAPPSAGVQGRRHAALRKPHTRPLHMGAAHGVGRPGIWYAPGIDPAISRGLSACPSAGPTATVGGGGGGVGTRPWCLALLACGGAYWPLANGGGGIWGGLIFFGGGVVGVLGPAESTPRGQT